MSDLIREAISFAARAHEGQKRKDGKTPYFAHCARVGQAAAENFPTYYEGKYRYEQLVAAAYLHDVLEDTHFTADDLAAAFGEVVVKLVEGLTNIKYVTKRGEQKFLDRLRLQDVSIEVKILKALDRLDNLRDLAFVESRPSQDFANVYTRESIALAHALWFKNQRPTPWAMNILYKLCTEIQKKAWELFINPPMREEKE